MTQKHVSVTQLTGQTLGRRRLLQLGAAVVAAGGASQLIAAAPAMADDVVYASSFGFDPDDATDALQQALDSTAHTVIIDDPGAEWLTRPLSVNRDNVCIVVQPGVTVRAKPGGYPGTGDTLLRVTGRSGISIFGYGATFAMNKQEYIDLNDGSQWRMALSITSSSDVTVEGLTLTGAGGDGIYVGRVQSSGYATCSSNVTIRNIWCDNNFRNGLSVISVDNLLVEGCAFTNSSGVVQTGIDFEPNLNDEQLTDVIVRDCVLENNAWEQLTVSLHALPGATTPISILFDRLRLGHQSIDVPTFAYYGPPTGDPGGTVELRDSYIETAPYSSSMAVVYKQASGASMTFTRTVALDWGNQAGHYQPINFLGLTMPEFGGVTWTDCLLMTDQQTPFLSSHRSSPDSTRVTGIHGNITVVDPYGVTTDLGSNTDDIALDIRPLSAIPASAVQVQALRSTVCRGAPITLLFTRDSADLAAPLAIRYSLSGSAVERVDTDGCAEMVVIPPGATSARATVGTRRGPAAPPGSRTAVFTIEPTIAYSIGSSSSATVTITD